VTGTALTGHQQPARGQRLAFQSESSLGGLLNGLL